MSNTMFFPETWEEFLKDYEFKDSKEIYTNGAMLIPSFRVEQMMEHYTHIRHGRWEWKCGIPYCSNCGEMLNGYSYDGDINTTPYCSNCGAKMDG